MICGQNKMGQVDFFVLSDKDDSVQEACVKCLAENEVKILSIQLDMLERLKTKASKVFCFVFHAGFKITNFDV